MCVACRRILSRDKLFRFVRKRGTKAVLLNADGRLPGKGLYLCRDRECWERLQSRRNLKRSVAAYLEPKALEEISRSLGGKDR